MQGPRGARVRGQQEGTPGTQLWGPVGGGISAAQKGAFGGLPTCLPLRAGCGGGPPLVPHLPRPFECEDVETRKPSLAGDSSEPDLGSLHTIKMFFVFCFSRGEVIKTRLWDLPPRTFKSLLESEIRWL